MKQEVLNYARFPYDSVSEVVIYQLSEKNEFQMSITEIVGTIDRMVIADYLGNAGIRKFEIAIYNRSSCFRYFSGNAETFSRIFPHLICFFYCFVVCIVSSR